MDKITFCIPSKSNLRYLKGCIESIRNNAYRKDHDIIVFVDQDNDGTVAWLIENHTKYNINWAINPDMSKLFGIGKAYDKCIDLANTDIVMIFHADMILGKNADLHAFKHLQRGTVVCSTRIEPPLHPNNGEKLIANFGIWPEEFKTEEFNTYVDKAMFSTHDTITNGMFAPWMIYKEDIWAIGGHDPRMHSAREDSDLFNRFVLKGYELIQSWESFVYHFTGRGGQFQHGTISTMDAEKSAEWRTLMLNSTKEFIRKWGSEVRHTNMMMPIIHHKYNVRFKIRNVGDTLGFFEPFCDRMTVEDSYTSAVDTYCKVEQPNTVVDLHEKFNSRNVCDITVSFDASKLTQASVDFIINLSQIITDNIESPGVYEYDIFKL
jgi:glycosyltransferase involved in cell wall biosynthesis